MSLFSMNQFSPVPLAERDQDQSHLPLFTLASDGSSCLRPILFDTLQERGANYGVHHLLQQEPNEHLFIRKSSDHLITFPTNYNNNTTTTTTNEEFFHDRDSIHLDGPTKWMSSKMWFRRKMMNSDHVIMSKPRRNTRVVEDQVHSNQDSSMSSSRNNNGSSPSGFIRVCSNCSTTKTPLWRSGPRGPKSLCNACGIRQRKARRAMDTAAAASGGLIPGEVPGKVRKERRSVVDRTIPFKKRCKNATITATQNKKLCFDDAMVGLSKSSAVHRVFPQDERDAALLLMALSWGIVRS